MDDQIHMIVVSGYSDYTVEDFLKVAGPEHLFSYIPKPLWPDNCAKSRACWPRKTKSSGTAELSCAAMPMWPRHSADRHRR